MTEQQQAINAQPSQTAADQEQAATRQVITAWTASGETALRRFLRTETGSATLLVGGTVAALIWSNVASGGYEAFWAARLTASVASINSAAGDRKASRTGSRLWIPTICGRIRLR